MVGGTRFYERKEIKDAMAYLRLALNPYDSVSFSRVLNWPGRGIGERSEDELNRWATALGVPNYVALQMLDAGDGNEALLQPPSPTSHPPSPFAARTKTTLLTFLHLLDELIEQR